MKPCTDLVERVVKLGDRAALEALVAGTHADIYRLLVSELRHEADAEDATQEVFRQVILSIGGLREPAAFPGWIYRIALDKARSARRLRRLAHGGSQGESALPLEMDPVEREETRAAVQKAVEGLDDDLREAVRLRYEHDLTYPEIARALQCPEGTVASRLSTAHQRLRQALAGAGVALALASLEQELAAAPASVAPARLTQRVKDMAQRAPLVAGSAFPPPSSRGRAAGLAVAVGLALVVALLVAPRLRTKSGPDSTDSRFGGASGGGLDAAKDPARTDKPPAAKREESPVPPGAARVTGRVFDRRTLAPIPGADVALLPEGEPAGRKEIVTHSDADGGFGLEAAPGRWRLYADAHDYPGAMIERSILLYWRDAHRQDFPGGPHAIEGEVLDLAGGLAVTRDFALGVSLEPDAPLEGVVRDDQGSPVAGARVEMRIHWLDVGAVPGAPAHDGPFDDRIAVPFSDGHARAATDATGRYRFASVYPRGEVELRASAPGFVSAEQRFNLPPVASADFVLRRGVQVRCEVADPDGRPIAGAHILSEPAPGRESIPLGFSSADGRFATDTAAPSTRFIAAWAPGHGWAVATRSEAPAKFELPVAASVLRGVVVDATGAPVADARVLVSQLLARHDGIVARLGSGGLGGDSPEGEWHAYLPGGTEFPETKTAADGTFEISGVSFANGRGVFIQGVKPAPYPAPYQHGKLDVWEDGWVTLRLTPEGK